MSRTEFSLDGEQARSGSMSVLRTSDLRREQMDARHFLETLSEMVDTLPTLTTPGQRFMMQKIVLVMRERLEAHADRNERVYFPLLSRRARSRDLSLLAVLAQEHRLIERWTDELARDAQHAAPDPTHFARRAGMLIDFLAAHLQDEEALLPLLDACRAAAQASLA